ncbi:choline transporter-like protein 4 isoform X1 [Schistocerca americana]|uniref:choline transporter-like protein 4 isoform X1 n=1 Tax=Schistocerca americana TaxID=7009 RepID=UPI001F4FEBD7|nr:choline transporter-like protein 4 isoform X1 [Schistocerca americana]XP_047111948.1 choline transporter-like protein 4 isoform X1 [Schistocerca piceifrons]
MGKKSSEQHGKKFQHDPDFRGPLHHRSCTDVICLLLWVVFIAAWIAIGCVAFVNGDPTQLLHPKDSSGQRCGLDEGVKNKPYLMYFELTNCVLNTSPLSATDCPTTKVCVSECPQKYFTFSGLKRYDDIINDLYCTYGTKEKLLSMESITNAVNSGECAAWYVPSQRVGKRCLPVPKINSTLLKRAGVDVEEFIDGQTIKQNLTHIGETILANLEDNWPWIAGFMGIAEVVCIVYIILMQFLAGVMVWLSLLAAVGLNAYCVYACYAKYDELRTKAPEESSSAVLANKDTWLVLLILSSIMLVIVLLVLLFLRKRINIAVGLIREASRAVACLKSTLAFPVLSWVLQCIVIAWAIIVTFYLLSCADTTYRFTKSSEISCSNNEYNAGDICDPSTFTSTCGNCTEQPFKYKEYVTYFHVVNIFGFLWGMCFVSGFSEMILAGAFATWYWTFKKDDVPFLTSLWSIGRTVRYHLGTVAFGSLILAICKFIRLVLEYINAKLQKYDNIFIKAVMCCLRCFFWCLEKFIKFINKNAYIMCAIHGKNFCKSARTAFNLIMRNILRTVVLDKVTDFLLFLGKLAVTAGMLALSFYVFVDRRQDSDEYNLVPVFLVGVGTYFIAHVCFGVYSMAVDTLFLCFLEDLERNDGSPQKPYFMSKKLLSILGKKNKKNK